jgi:hypothetical protein
VDGWQAVYGVREQLVAVLEAAAAGDVDPAAAAHVLEQLRSIWVREKRWRNDAPARAVVHVAGVVVSCREYRPSCPGYIVDRRQTCQRCGAELCRGRWSVFFDVGADVALLGTVAYGATGHEREVPCTDVDGV